MAMDKKTKSRSRWAADYDYVHKLSPEDNTWLEKFNREYYHGTFFSDDPLHKEKHKKDLYSANNANERDILNNCPAKVVKHRESIPDHRPSIKCRFYFEADYCSISQNPEDRLIDLIDTKKRAQLYFDIIEANRSATTIVRFPPKPIQRKLKVVG